VRSQLALQRLLWGEKRPIYILVFTMFRPIKDDARTGTTQFLVARNGTKTGKNPKTHEKGTHEMGKDDLNNRSLTQR
jgi:hypothetical protein